MDAVAMDVDECSKPSSTDGQNRPRKVQKRKRGCLEIEGFEKEERNAKIEGIQKEIESLFKYYEEVKGQKVDLDLGQCSSSNSVVAALLEESELPLSKLVDEIYEKMKNIDSGGGGVETVTVASVKASVLFVGQRVMYGVPNPDADVLEDVSKECLWCWETRDLKMVPKSTRGILNIRRKCRKKIHERITVLSAMMSALLKTEIDRTCIQEFIKASEKLGKLFDEAMIRSLVDGLSQKTASEMAVKEAKREEKLMVKQLERSQREAEKEKKRIDREQQKEKLQNEKESKVTEREEKRRREKEEIEMKKQLKKQEEDAEKDQRRRQREEAESKKRLSVLKQASIMERFLKKTKPSPSCQNDCPTTELTTSVPLSKQSENMLEACTQFMDCTLSSSNAINSVDIRRLHLSSWRFIGHSIRSRGKNHWGIRQKPKCDLFKELKLSNGRESANDGELGEERLVDGWEEQITDDRTSHTEFCSSLPHASKLNRGKGKQLLQFSKSYRPAFYGIWSTKSHVVGPRHPFRKDPDLDYDVDSDEEWEEEDPGESLSDCDKDDEENLEEEGCAKAEDDEDSEDGFFVPDGYLSENEGVEHDRMETDDVDEVRSTPSSKQDMEGKELYSLFKQQKHLYNMTELALRKNQPLIVLNLLHEKDNLLMAEDLDGTSKLEQTCLAALSMRLMQGGCPVEILVDRTPDEDPEMCLPSAKESSTQISTSAILDSDMAAIVSTIQSCSQGINKVVESLQQKFPTVPKSHLRNKVREVSDFVENRWQVKKEILEKHGVLVSPEKSIRRPKTIAAFFSKRCLPPTGKCINVNETSPQSLKPGSTVQDQKTYTNQ